jgi:adenosylmethionine---8-amino-7-oxononanoate aminotransferase
LRDWVELDKRYIWHPFTQMEEWLQSDNLIIERAEGVYLFDTTGAKYIDGVSSLWVNIHGHRKNEIDEAVANQMRQVAHSTLLGLGNTPSISLAEKLVEISPTGLERVFYSDSGSTAVEVALKIAFQYWKNKGNKDKKLFVGLDQAYHGDTIGSVSLGGIDIFHSIFSQLLFPTLVIPAPFPYRNPNTDPDDLRDQCLETFEKIAAERSGEIAALIVEPCVQGAAGIIVHPVGFLKGLETICRKYDILLICDEVATGFGRTGAMFACDLESVHPDIMCFAKGLTGGYLPLAATLTTNEIFEAFLGPYSDYKTFFHGHSYTGNPLACAAAKACLDIFVNESVLAKLQPKITFLTDLLSEVFQNSPHVGDIRQCGFMVGVELARNKALRTPFPVELRMGAQVTRNIQKHGVILRPLGDVIVIMPPLAIENVEIETIIRSLEKSIKETCET